MTSAGPPVGPPDPGKGGAQEGEPDALLRAYFDKRANLIRFFAARAGSPTAAEDLTQELYLKIAARHEPIDARSPNALLYRMAANLLLDQARSASRSARRDAAWRNASRSEIGGVEVSQEPPADESLEHRQRLRRMLEAVSDLPPQAGKAFRLHKLEGLSHAQTAQAMGISVKGVEKHISAALKALTKRLSA